jgi:hypothetical protein
LAQMDPRYVQAQPQPQPHPHPHSYSVCKKILGIMLAETYDLISTIIYIVYRFIVMAICFSVFYNTGSDDPCKDTSLTVMVYIFFIILSIGLAMRRYGNATTMTSEVFAARRYEIIFEDGMYAIFNTFIIVKIFILQIIRNDNECLNPHMRIIFGIVISYELFFTLLTIFFSQAFCCYDWVPVSRGPVPVLPELTQELLHV